jgi:RecB family exonuclease
VTEHLALGNALHLALELAHKNPPFNFEFALQAFLKEYDRIIIEDEVFVPYPKMKKLRSEGVSALEVYYHGLAKDESENDLIEVEKEFKLPFEEILVVGKIDKIQRRKATGGLIVTDYKSGSREPDEWFFRHDLQFSTYAWAALELYGELPEQMIWHHLRNGKRLVTQRTLQDIAELKTMMHTALNMHKQGIIYRVYHQQVCEWCPFKGDICDDRELEARLVAQRDNIRANKNTEGKKSLTVLQGGRQSS